MIKATLIFPDTSSLADFILRHHIRQAEVNTAEQTLTAWLSDDEMITACREYEAVLKESLRYLPS